ncbi:MAG: ABC transporter permease [Actinobacteria bacterium]|nr:ABC transporter permease [Actinomycetota bacterium]MCI0678701.1 ABC transporter permease [Actinomycetota bacterium]
MPTNLASGADYDTVGQRRWMWPGFAIPGVVWLILLFLVPFYAIFAVAMGQLDPVIQRASPEWNPLYWDPTIFAEAFADLLGGQLGVIALRTILYVFVASALCLVIGYPVAYFVARKAGRWRWLWLILILAPFWINYLMRMMSWVNLLSPDGQMNSLLINVFGVVDPPNWLAGNDLVVILGLVYGYIPFFILPLFAALDRIDDATLEAARDLGASSSQTFWRVTWPLSRNGVLGGLVIIMLPMFGDYYTPNLLSGSPRTRMLGNTIDQFFNQTTSQGSLGAALTIILMIFVAGLMVYYLRTINRATQEARR